MGVSSVGLSRVWPYLKGFILGLEGKLYRLWPVHELDKCQGGHHTPQQPAELMEGAYAKSLQSTRKRG